MTRPQYGATALGILKGAGAPLSLDDILDRWPSKPKPARTTLIGAMHNLFVRRRVTGVERVKQGVYEYAPTFPERANTVKARHKKISAAARNQRQSAHVREIQEARAEAAPDETVNHVRFDVAAAAKALAWPPAPIEVVGELKDGALLIKYAGKVWIAREV